MELRRLQYDSNPVSGVIPPQGSVSSSEAFLRLLFGGLCLLVFFAFDITPVAAGEGKLTLSPSALEFGDVSVGSSHALSLRIGNTGKANIVFSHEFITGSGFSLIGFHLPLTLSPGHDLNVIVKFSPSKLGMADGKIYLGSNASNGSVTIDLAGNGFPRNSNPSGSALLSATPGSANFADVPLGTSNTQTIQLKNIGEAKATISGFNISGSTFTVKGLGVSQTIPAGNTASFEVVFSPKQSGQYTGELTVDLSTSQKKLTIPLTGTGVADTRLISVSPTAVNFGSTVVGAQTTASVVLQNMGNSGITISKVTLSGSGFSATGLSSGLTIGPGQSALLNVEFSPSTVGAKSGTVAITSNASNSVTSIPLSGLGVTSSAHTVQLTWQSSSSPNVAGYNVYRANSPNGTFAKLNSTLVATTAYSDQTVQSGQTYLYEVTTVGSDGVESAPSNPVDASIP